MRPALMALFLNAVRYASLALRWAPVAAIVAVSAVLLAAAVHTEALLARAVVPLADPLLFARVTALGLVDMVLRVYLFALLLYWLTSYLSRGSYAPGVRLLAQLCEPILRPVRRLIPPIGQIDFSVLWVAIAISALLILLR